MSFAHPYALALFALALPVALLYLTRVRRRELAVGTNQFWEQVLAEQHFRSAWQRLRDVGSLLVQLLLLALLTSALAEPLWSSQTKEARQFVFVIDGSASMNASDGNPDRLNDAKQAIRGAVAGLREVDQAALIVAGIEPRVACGLTTDHRALGRGLDALAPADSPTSVREAVGMARLLLAAHPRGRIEVFTDGCFKGVDDLAGAPDVALHRFGRRTANVGITRFQARRSFRDPTGYQLLIEVGNFSDQPVECRLEVERNGLVLDALPLRLAPEETFRRVLDKASIDGGRLSARIDRDDALACDNQAWAILPSREPLPVTLVAGGDSLGDLYLEKVLEANPLIKQPVPVVSDPLAHGSGDVNEIRVYHQRAPAHFPPGLALVVAPTKSCDLWEVGGKVIPPLVGTQDRTSLLLSYVKLESVVIAHAHQLTLKSKATTPALFVNGEPLVAVFDRPIGNVVVLSASIEDPTDLPLRTAFPIIVGNVLTWLDRGQLDLNESFRVGGMVELALTGKEHEIWSPDGRIQPCTTFGDRVKFGPLDRCGVWRVDVRSDGASANEVVCNLADPAESDLRPSRGLPDSPPADRAGVPLRPPWFLLTGAALGLTIVEWRLYQRRWLN